MIIIIKNSAYVSVTTPFCARRLHMAKPSTGVVPAHSIAAKIFVPV